MTRRICFFHRNDLDGHASGALVKLKYPDAELVGIDYPDKATAIELIRKHEIDNTTEIFMVDFSLQPFNEMIELIKACQFFTWCDHHKTAIEEYDKLSTDETDPLPLHVYLNSLKAGCELTWDALYEEFETTPEFISLLGRYDVWDHQNPKVLPFQYGMRLKETNPEDMNWNLSDSNIWERLLALHHNSRSHTTSEIIREGATVLKYIQKDNKGLIESSYFECYVGDLHCIAVNKLGGNSQVFEAMWDETKWDAMLLFGFNGRRWRYSLYTSKPNVDVSIVAKKLGGGGHAKAAGWVSDNPIIKVLSDDDNIGFYKISLPS